MIRFDHKNRAIQGIGKGNGPLLIGSLEHNLLRGQLKKFTAINLKNWKNVQIVPQIPVLWISGKIFKLYHTRILVPKVIYRPLFSMANINEKIACKELTID